MQYNLNGQFDPSMMRAPKTPQMRGGNAFAGYINQSSGGQPLGSAMAQNQSASFDPAAFQGRLDAHMAAGGNQNEARYAGQMPSTGGGYGMAPSQMMPETGGGMTYGGQQMPQMGGGMTYAGQQMPQAGGGLTFGGMQRPPTGGAYGLAQNRTPLRSATGQGGAGGLARAAARRAKRPLARAIAEGGF